MNELINIIESKREEVGFYEDLNKRNLFIEEIIKDKIKNFLKSERYVNIKKGVNYYKGQHDIMNRRVFYVVDGRFIEGSVNNKIKNTFHQLLVDQKAEHLLGDLKFEIKDDQRLKEYIGEYITEKKLKTVLNDLIIDTSNSGAGFLHCYKTNEGAFNITNIDSDEVVFILDNDHEEVLKYIIRFYPIKKERKDGKEIDIFKIEYWDRTHVYFYILEDEELYLDTQEELNPRPHFIEITKEGESVKDIKEGSFFDLPFFMIKNNKYMMTDLQNIKELIDDYDITSSDWSNIQEKNIEGVWMFSGLDPNQKLSEIMEGIKINNGFKVPKGVDAKHIELNLSFEGRQQRLKELRDNIFLMGQGVDTTNTEIGNVSGVALKMRFEGLNMKCRKIKNYIEEALEWLVKMIISDINRKYGTTYKEEDFNIIIEQKLIINEKETEEIKEIQIKNALSLLNILSEKTIIEDLLPRKFDYDKEKEQREEEQKNNIIIEE